MRVATAFGIPLRIHWSMSGLLAIIGLGALLQGGFEQLAYAGAMSVMLLGSVLLHELGHALAAKGFGIRTAHITLYPFGGIAAMTEMPRSPRQEFIIAFAGPAVNGALVLVAMLGGLLTGWWGFAVLGAVNGVMGLFNLIPAFPMDGGRILRALLAKRIGLYRASDIAIRVGRGFAWLFVVGGVLWGNWSLAFVGAFMIFATHQERLRLQELLYSRAWQQRWGGPSENTWWRDWEPGRS